MGKGVVWTLGTELASVGIGVAVGVEEPDMLGVAVGDAVGEAVAVGLAVAVQALIFVVHVLPLQQ